ncbi:hypothetical protein GEMRC1_002817 [Eukaryota sp. GEM-RC1]
MPTTRSTLNKFLTVLGVSLIIPAPFIYVHHRIVKCLKQLIIQDARFTKRYNSLKLSSTLFCTALFTCIFAGRLCSYVFQPSSIVSLLFALSELTAGFSYWFLCTLLFFHPFVFLPSDKMKLCSFYFAVILTVILSFVTFETSTQFVVTHHSISTHLHPLKRPLQKPVKLAVISDIHITGSFMSMSQLTRVSDIIKTLNADYCLILGDVIDVPNARQVFSSKDVDLSVLNNVAKNPTIAILGNHDLYSDKEAVADIITQANITLLRGTSLKVEELEFLGINDYGLSPLPYLTDEIGSVLAKADTTKFPIVLVHQPIVEALNLIDQMSSTTGFLSLSGHVHRGQLFPLQLPLSWKYRFFYGKYSFANGFAIVSSGIGNSVCPFRGPFSSRPEILSINLH